MYKAYITKVKNIRPAENADKLNLCDVFGNTVVVDKTINENDLYIYFPCDGQLSLDYCLNNNLLRKLPDGTPSTGYMDPDKRNVVAIKLRGNRSDGLVMPLTSLNYLGVNLNSFKMGDIINVIDGKEICRKYIPRSNSANREAQCNGNIKAKDKNPKDSYPYFKEHIDTPQLRFNMSMFKPGDYICLTEKVHGTSSRNANTIKISYKRNLFDKLFGRKGKKVSSHDYVVGTRRTIVKEKDGGYYGTNAFRMKWGDFFKGKLNPGEEVFGEIAGFYAPNAPIMGRGDNKKTNDKDFIKQFGATTTFSYGCNEEMGENKYFVYRMTYTSPDGFVFEYPWDMVKLRAEQMGLETVPELDRFIYTTEEDFLARVYRWTDGASTIDPTHIIEGVVVRSLNAPTFKVAKSKGFFFKVIEGIVKANADAPDMEEAQEVENA